MQAIILAAGMGKRLGELTKENTKCMVKVGNETLIERVLRQLSGLKLNKIILVVGYEGKKLINFVGTEISGIPIEYVENPIYDQTNNIYSLWLASAKLEEDDTLLLESDLIFDEKILDKLVEAPYPSLAAVAKFESWMDGTVVTVDEDFRIVDLLSKKAFKFCDIQNYYKTINIYKFSKEFSTSHFVPFLGAYSKALGRNEYYEQVLRIIAMLDEPEIKVLPIEHEKWYEIDDVQDLDIAETIFADAKDKTMLYHKRFGGYWRFPEMLDYCYLVNPFFPPQKMKEELRSNFDKLLCEYPSGMGVNRLLAAKYFGISKENVLVGNGAAELINSMCRLIPGKFGVSMPTFEEYTNRLGEQRCEIFYPTCPDYHYTAKELMEWFGGRDIKTLLLINPDNPSGNFIPYLDLLTLIAWAEERGIRIVVDESFVDFAENGLESTLLCDEILCRYKNLIVVKSISKSYGVPGLRLGILATSDNDVLEKIRADVSIWNINSFAEFYMQIFSKYEGGYKKACSKFMEERKFFAECIQAISFLRVIPSQANYFLCEVTGKYTSRELTDILLADSNILIKNCAGKQGLEGRNYIRLAIRDRGDNIKLVEALQNLMDR